MPDTGSQTPPKQSRFTKVIQRLFKRSSGSAKRASHDLAMGQVLKARNVGRIPKWSQLRELPRLLSKTERRLAGFTLLVLVITSTALGIRLINSTRTVVPAIGGEYTEGFIGIPQLINPLYASTSDVDSDLAALIFSGLMHFDSNQGLVTDLAESYEISEDQTEYTFTLRDDAKWHDGQPVRVDDVIFTISAIQNTEYRSPLEVSFSGIDVEQIDERTVKFTLDEPFSPFLSLMTIGILPSHLWQDITPINAPVAELNRKPVGSGPYSLEKITRDGKGNIHSYTLVRHERYHGDGPYIQTLDIKFYPEITSGIEALRNQNVEGLAYIPAEHVHDFSKVNAIKINLPALQQYTALFFNQKIADELQIDEVRQALSYGTDKSILTEQVLLELARPIDSFILPGMIGSDADFTVYSFNQSEAIELLEEAGWVLEEEAEFRTKDEDVLSFTITTVNSSELIAVAESIQSQWKEIGIQIDIRIISNTELQNDIIPNKSYDILLSGELYGTELDPYIFWHSSQISGQGLNLARFSNRKADEYIITGRSTNDIEERTEAYTELQSIIANEIPAIFLYQPFYPYAQAKKIQGGTLERIMSPSDRFSTVSSWFIKTRNALSRKE